MANTRVRPITYKVPRWVKRPGNCALCGIWRPGLHRDHIVPKWKGGPDTEDNCQYICANCHQDKSAEDMRGHQFTKGRTYKNRGNPPYKCTPEHKAAIRAAHLGIPLSEERKKKISIANTAVAARKREIRIAAMGIL